MLATGRPWVRQEGWLLKESSGLGGGWQLRYFVVAGDRLEYFKEEVTKLSLRPGERLGVDVDKGNLVSRAAPGGAAASQRALAENEGKILAELLASAGSPADIGGYYKPDDAKAEIIMRPSATLNGIIDPLLKKSLARAAGSGGVEAMAA